METETEPRPFDGRNGTIILDAERIIIGKVPGRMYDYQRHLTVTVDIRVERVEKTLQTVDHGEVRKPLNFSIISSIWRPDGKDCVSSARGARPVMEVAHQGKPEKGFTRTLLWELAAFGDRWHRNDMRASCAHQRVVTRGGQVSADACPQTGYRYGQAWLVEPLPSGFMATLSGLLAPANQDRIYVVP